MEASGNAGGGGALDKEEERPRERQVKWVGAEREFKGHRAGHQGIKVGSGTYLLCAVRGSLVKVRLSACVRKPRPTSWPLARRADALGRWE